MSVVVIIEVVIFAILLNITAIIAVLINLAVVVLMLTPKYKYLLLKIYISLIIFRISIPDSSLA